MRTMCTALPACTLVVLAGIATAAPQYGGTTYGGATNPVTGPQPTYTSEEESSIENTLERYGIGLMLGGGVEDFTDSTLRNATGIAGSWDVRLAVGLRELIALEVSYAGSAQSINVLGLDNDAKLIGNGAQGVLRVNILDYNLQPFLFGGIGWRHYTITGTPIRTSAIVDNDDVLEVPVGAGGAWKYRGFLVDLRAAYLWTTDEDLLNRIDPDARMSRWGVNASLGYAF